MSASVRRVVVVGASSAGLAAARTLREEGFAGSLVLVGAETHPPYDRPPLSKQILAGEWDSDRLALAEPREYDDLGIELLLGRPATRLDVADRRIGLRDGRELPFDGVVIATGVRARSLPHAAGMPGVHTVRTLDDGVRLAAALRTARRVVVLGAGFLGCEVAASARRLGAEVTLIEPGAGPLSALGSVLGRIVARLHEDRGVSLRLGRTVDGVLDGDGRPGVRLSTGEIVRADVVVAAIGSVPATEWLADSGLDLADGVVCDAFCAAAPGVFVAGDVARWFHRGAGRTVRVEHKLNATEQGAAAARNLLGAREPFTPLPFFWTDQFDARIQVYGFPAPDCAFEVVAGSPGERRFLAHYRRDGRVVAVLGWNMPKELREAREADLAPLLRSGR